MGGRTKGGCAPKSQTGKLSHGPSTVTKKYNRLTIILREKAENNALVNFYYLCVYFLL